MNISYRPQRSTQNVPHSLRVLAPAHEHERSLDDTQQKIRIPPGLDLGRHFTAPFGRLQGPRNGFAQPPEVRADGAHGHLVLGAEFDRRVAHEAAAPALGAREPRGDS